MSQSILKQNTAYSTYPKILKQNKIYSEIHQNSQKYFTIPEISHNCMARVDRAVVMTVRETNHSKMV